MLPSLGSFSIPLSLKFVMVVVLLFSIVFIVVSRVVYCIGIFGHGCSLITTTRANLVVFLSL